MVKIFLRLLLNFFSKFIKTDSVAYKFPISVKGIITDEDRIMLLKNERNEWDLPGGKLSKNEKLARRLIKEVKQETNLDISVGKLSLF